MPYNLGIDIGIASIGFAGVDLEKQKILFCGSHIFEAAENPKDGSSLAAPRREKRGQRRVIGRRRTRKQAVRRLLAKHGLKDIEAINASRHGAAPDVWELRREALARKLTNAEFARVLFHISRHRGFQSNRKGGDTNDTDGKKALSAADELEARWIESGEKTIGAYLATQSKRRNSDGCYENFIKRTHLRHEVRQIFDAQRKLGNENATPALECDYAGSGKPEERNTLEGDGVAFFQRPLQSSEHLVGECTLVEGEKRAPKFSYTAELFILWNRLNNARIKTAKGDERPLSPDQKKRLADLAHKFKSGVTYAKTRKELDLSDDERFNIGYRKLKDDDNSWEKIRDNAEKSVFLQLPGYHALKDALDTGSAVDWQKWIGPERDRLDDIARILSFHEDRKQVDELLSGHGLNKTQKEALCRITNFGKTVDLSLKAIHAILPFMQEGERYDEACKSAGLDHSRKKNKGLDILPPFKDIRNPVVNRAMAQARKVINACIRKYGMPEKIIVELAREVGKPFKDRKNIEREQKKNEAYREEARKHAAEILGTLPENVSGTDILRYRLWYKEQQKICFYCGGQITTEDFRNPTATQIDHIIPYSRSWDDSYMNKTVCHTHCNQEKGNRTPYEWLNGTQTWEGVSSLVSMLPPKKAERFLMETFPDREQGWKERNINDTRYMARLLKNHLEQNLDLDKGNRVQTRNGALTANLRGAWGFPDKNRRNDRHHAIDAIVLACSTQGMVQRFSNWNRFEAWKKNPAKRPKPPAPWDRFRNDTMDMVHGPKNERGQRQGGIFVTRMPVRKITGPAHEETIRSVRQTPNGGRQVVQRVKLRSLTLGQLENLVDKERNIRLYNTLKERLDAHDGKPDKAFATPVYMPVNDPAKQGPEIRSVQIITSEKSGVPINHGLASNGDMVRVDVFRKDGKYHLVPIYVHHFAQDKLPNRAIVAYKDESEWTEVDDADFLFSLYRNDYVRIVTKKEETEGYYAGTHRGTGAVSVKAHDNDPSFGKNGTKEGIGIKSALAFEKYSVDYFGYKHRIYKEQRLGVAQCDDTESGETGSGAESAAAGE